MTSEVEVFILNDLKVNVVQGYNVAGSLCQPLVLWLAGCDLLCE